MRADRTTYRVAVLTGPAHRIQIDTEAERRLVVQRQPHAKIDTENAAGLDAADQFAFPVQHQAAHVAALEIMGVAEAAEEDRRVGSTLRDYTLDGLYRSHSLPVFDADAEGVALWACDADAGYWIAVDQLRPTVFRLYDRKNLELVKTFSGKVVANTDGQVLYAVATPRFPAGALYALHDDKAVAAFDLRDIVRALGLSDRCM